MSEHLLDNLRETFQLPEIDADRCVHSIIEKGRCQACVDSCPVDAWIIDDEQLGIRTDRCDGCGLCATACPESAITADQPPVQLRTWNGRMLALVTCARGGVTAPADATLSCVHVVGLQQVLALWLDGCRNLFTLTGDCVSCDRATGSGPNLNTTVSTLNRILRSRGLAPLVLKTANASVWKRVHFKSRERADTHPLDRRGFFRQTIAGLAQQSLEPNDDVGSTTPHLLSRLPDIDPETDLFPHVPQIDTDRCTGCNGCINTCPHDALQLVDNDENTYYAINAEHCTGCMVCSDVCASDALRIKHGGKPSRQRKIPLQRGRCRSCGTTFHKPDSTGRHHDLCHVCAVCNHQKNLYQVLDTP